MVNSGKGLSLGRIFQKGSIRKSSGRLPEDQMTLKEGRIPKAEVWRK